MLKSSLLFFRNYNKYRTHLGINKDSPDARPVQLTGKIDKMPAVKRITSRLLSESRVVNLSPIKIIPEFSGITVPLGE